MTVKFQEMPKIGRLSRECVITEKIDGTNASIYISEPAACTCQPHQNIGHHFIYCDVDKPVFLTGSRTRWVTPEDDNHGFSRWAHAHKEELMTLGPGHHFGEWWGIGIQRNYGLKEKRFSLFNTGRWGRANVRPACCGVVPVIYQGIFDSTAIDFAMQELRDKGSFASPGFMKPEGIVVYHAATKTLFKKTLERDDKPKGQKEE